MKCVWIFFHRWTKWREVQRGMADFTDAFGREGNANVIVIERECQDCGLKQIRRQSTSHF